MDKLDEVLRRHTVRDGDGNTQNKLLGAAFMVTDAHGKSSPTHTWTIYSGASGRLHLDATSARFSDTTVTWVASLTKLATTLCVMRLVEEGALDLDADLRPLVPELAAARILRGFDDDGRPLYEDNAAAVTMRQLLTHTSGFGYDFADADLHRWWSVTAPGRQSARVCWTKMEITMPLRFEPGMGWMYGVGLDWAGQVLERVTGLRLGEYMQRHVFEPLGMQDSGFYLARLPWTAMRTAENVVRKRDMTLRSGGPPMADEEHEIEAGGGGLYTTAADYVRLLRAFLQHRLVSAEMTAQMLAPQLDETRADIFNLTAFHPLVKSTMAPEFPPGQRLNHGLGGMINVENVPGKRRAGSMAWSGLLNSRWWADPESGIAAVLIVNVRPKGDAVVAKLYDELERAVYGELLATRSRSRI